MNYEEIKAYLESLGVENIQPTLSPLGGSTEIELEQATIDSILADIQAGVCYRDIKRNNKQGGKSPSSRQINLIKAAWEEVLTGG